MDGCSFLRKTPRAPLRIGFSVAVIAAGLALLAISVPPASAQDKTPSASNPSNEQCLGCHGSPGMEKKLGDGGALQLHVAGDTFAKSVHASVGCAGCHSDVDLAAHPPEKKDIGSARSFSVAMTQVCRGCHTDKFDQWESSIHAALVRASNPAAPVCTDCHNPHAVIKGAAESIDQVPCKTCHSDIYTAYLGSMHAKARIKSDQSYAPICSGCHSAHAVKATSIGQGPKEACFGCHADVLDAHQKWLPNAAVHFEVVSCPACHAPNAQRKVDLMLIDSKDAQPLGTEQLGVPLFEASSKSNGEGIDAQTLWNLLQTLNRSGIAGNTVVRGRLEASTGPQKHELADKSKALSDCRTCHSAGSQAFQSVTISLVKPEGQRIGYGANADVLNSVMSLQSVGGFYAIGSTRIKLLDILLILAIVGGVGFAVGHVILAWIFKYLGLYHPAIGGHREGRSGHPGDGQGPKAA
jgi:hypothetical protein